MLRIENLIGNDSRKNAVSQQNDKNRISKIPGLIFYNDKNHNGSNDGGNKEDPAINELRTRGLDLTENPDGTFTYNFDGKNLPDTSKQDHN